MKTKKCAARISPNDKSWKSKVGPREAGRKNKDFKLIKAQRLSEAVSE